MAKKRVTRKQLLKEPDEFITFSGKLIAFFTEHRKPLVASVIGFFLLLSSVAGYRYYVARAEANGFTRLNEAMQAYAEARQSQNPSDALGTVEPDYEAVIDQYGGRRAGAFARWQYANSCYAAGKYEKAIRLYQQAYPAFGDKPFYRRQILSSLGQAYMQAGDDARAISTFEKIVDAPDARHVDEALFLLGLLYERNGQPEKSKQMMDRIRSEYTDSIYQKLAEARADHK